MWCGGRVVVGWLVVGDRCSKSAWHVACALGAREVTHFMTCDRAFAQAEVNGEWVTVGESVDLLTYQAAIHGSEVPAGIWCAITQT
jgi:hypothetical protein